MQASRVPTQFPRLDDIRGTADSVAGTTKTLDGCFGSSRTKSNPASVCHPWMEHLSFIYTRTLFVGFLRELENEVWE